MDLLGVRFPDVRPLRRAALALITVGAVLALSPAAGADPGSPSYDQGRQSIDDAASHGPLRVSDLAAYCDTLMRWELKSGQIAVVESPADFISGCQDEGRTILSSQ